MSTKAKGDIAEQMVVLAALKNGLPVLRPVGDRLPYDLVVDTRLGLKKLQVKAAWFAEKTNCWVAETRRSCTNRRIMLRKRYEDADFDFAVIVLADIGVFYIIPIQDYNSFKGAITFVEGEKRQRKPRSSPFREAWHLLGVESEGS